MARALGGACSKGLRSAPINRAVLTSREGGDSISVLGTGPRQRRRQPGPIRLGALSGTKTRQNTQTHREIRSISYILILILYSYLALPAVTSRYTKLP